VEETARFVRFVVEIPSGSKGKKQLDVIKDCKDHEIAFFCEDSNMAKILRKKYKSREEKKVEITLFSRF